MLSFHFHSANTRMFIPMVLVMMNAHLHSRAALFYPGRRFASVCLDQASNVADAPTFGDDTRLSENSGGQLRNGRHPPCKSLMHPSHETVGRSSSEITITRVRLEKNTINPNGKKARRSAASEGSGGWVKLLAPRSLLQAQSPPLIPTSGLRLYWWAMGNKRRKCYC